MRIIARFSKGDSARFISHLDLQRLVQRTLRRAAIPVKYSMGFNPHPLLSFASALPVGYTGDSEYMDVRLDEDISIEEFLSRMNSALPSGIEVLDTVEVHESLPALTSLLTHADYVVTFYGMEPIDANEIQTGICELMSGAIEVEKRTKSGMKRVDIRPMLIEMRLKSIERQTVVLHVRGVLNASGGLNVELLIKAFVKAIGVEWSVNRAFLYFSKDFSNIEV